MPIWEIYAYWNINELHAVFNSIALMTSGDDFIGLIGTIMLFGLVAAVVVAISGSGDLVDAWKWFLIAVLLYLVLFIPKTSVALIDRTGTKPAIVVNNIPISIAVFGSLTSHVGNWLTTEYETNLAVIVPAYAGEGIKFQGNGLMFGHEILKEASRLSPYSTAVRLNFDEFFNRCVLPEFDTGNIAIEAVLSSNDLWSEVSNVNPSLFITLYNLDGTPSSTPVACDVAYNSILTPILNDQTQESLQKVASKLYQDKAPTIAKAAFEAALSNTYNYMFDVSKSATEIFKQRLAANMFSNSAGLNNQDLYAKTQAETLARQQYSILSQLAQTTIPKLRNIIEIILYAVFPIILVMMIVGGSKGFTVIKSYLISLLWIQLWAPLYAVMNFMMASYRRDEWLATIDPTNAMAVTTQSLINAGAQSDLNIAGMLALSIPMISYAIVKGGEMAMTAFVQSALAPAQQSAARTAGEVAMGNLSRGNVSADTHSANNTSMHAYDTQSTVNSGPTMTTAGDGTTFTYTTNDKVFADSSNLKNQGPAVELSSAISNEKSISANLAKATAESERIGTEATTNSIATSSTIRSNSNSFSVDKAIDESKTIGDKHAALQGWNDSTTAQSLLEQVNGFDSRTAAKINAFAQSEISTGVGISQLLETGWSARAGIKMSLEQENAATESLKVAFGNSTAQTASEGLLFQKELASSETLRESSGVSETDEKAIRDETAQQTSLNESHSASLEKTSSLSQSLEEANRVTNTLMMDVLGSANYNSLNQLQQSLFNGEFSNLSSEYVSLQNEGLGDSPRARSLSGSMADIIEEVFSAQSTVSQGINPSRIEGLLDRVGEEKNRINEIYKGNAGGVEETNRSNVEKLGTTGAGGNLEDKVKKFEDMTERVEEEQAIKRELYSDRLSNETEDLKGRMKMEEEEQASEKELLNDELSDKTKESKEKEEAPPEGFVDHLLERFGFGRK